MPDDESEDQPGAADVGVVVICGVATGVRGEVGRNATPSAPIATTALPPTTADISWLTGTTGCETVPAVKSTSLGAA